MDADSKTVLTVIEQVLGEYGIPGDYSLKEAIREIIAKLQAAQAAAVQAGPSDALANRLAVAAESWRETHPGLATLLTAARHALARYSSAATGGEADDALSQMTARKDAAYLERNQVVAALASAFPSGIARTAIEGWSEDWHGCVYIDLPTGQASWHYHDSQAHLFAHLPAYTKGWDGHTTEHKYERLAALAHHVAGHAGGGGATPPLSQATPPPSSPTTLTTAAAKTYDSEGWSHYQVVSAFEDVHGAGSWQRASREQHDSWRKAVWAVMDRERKLLASGAVPWHMATPSTTPAAGGGEGWQELTDEDRTRAFNSLPDMLNGFLKTWGWLHFAKAIEAECRAKNAPATPGSTSTPGETA